jgi:integrase
MIGRPCLSLIGGGGVGRRPGDASERRAYVPAADVERAIEHAPNGTWKLLIALSRFAGLRVPSEALSLRWQDVDWDRGRLTVPSPKTQHLAGRSYRVIPLFPAVRPYLEAAWDDAPEGAEYVIPETDSDFNSRHAFEPSRQPSFCQHTTRLSVRFSRHLTRLQQITFC